MKQPIANCDISLCAACSFGQACKTSTAAAQTKPKGDALMELKTNDLLPGQGVYADHYHCAESGCLYTNRCAANKA
eukprot:13837268-Ditylum_brightwellii.AAC.1